MTDKAVEIAIMITALISVLSIVSIVICYEYRIDTLEQEAKFEVGHLEPCPFCGKDVTLKQVNDSYYITCEKFVGNMIIGCDLRTGYYKSKKELVEQWNEMGGAE